MPGLQFAQKCILLENIFRVPRNVSFLILLVTMKTHFECRAIFQIYREKKKTPGFTNNETTQTKPIQHYTPNKQANPQQESQTNIPWTSWIFINKYPPPPLTKVRDHYTS